METQGVDVKYSLLMGTTSFYTTGVLEFYNWLVVPK